jgi:predicted DNA-binding protein (MmcQ/YjbR family)
MDAKEFTSELRRAVDTFDRTGATRLCQTLIKHLVTTDQDYPVEEAERALQILRNKRMFALMRRVGDAFIQTDRASLKVRRQYAQSLIDEGDLSAALSVLTELAVVANNDPAENAEVRGLIGRVHKQFYINAGNPKLTRNHEHLRRAIASYVDVYSADPPKHLWPGINVVACVKRAIRDGVPTDGFPAPKKLAAEILDRIETKQDDRTADTWDFATAVEACVALERHDEAVAGDQGRPRAQVEIRRAVNEHHIVAAADRLDDLHVGIIGAGLGGLCAAIRLEQAGIPYTVFDKNGDVVQYPRLYVVRSGQFVPYDRFVEDGGALPVPGK